MRKGKPRLRVFLWIVLILFSSSLTFAAGGSKADREFQTGKALFDRGEYSRAVAHLSNAAKLNHASAMNAVGFCYQKGKGVDRDYAKALSWYKQASSQGDATGAYNVGWLYLNGVGVAKDETEAKKWYILAARRGHKDAQSTLDKSGIPWKEIPRESTPRAESKPEGRQHRVSQDTDRSDSETVHRKPNARRQENPKGPEAIRESKARGKPKIIIEARQAKAIWHNGRWDSTVYNFINHPRTIGVRVKVFDAETGVPVKGAEIRIAGSYIKEFLGNSPKPINGPEKKEYRLSARSGAGGVSVFALEWQKEYPWRTYSDVSKIPARSGVYRGKYRAIDDVEKAQRIEVRHPRYRYAEVKLPFARFLDVGQNPKSDAQTPAVWNRFEKAWKDEAKRGDVVLCALKLGTKFTGFSNKTCTRKEFFEKIRHKEYGLIMEGPKNLSYWGEHPQSISGPYFIYSYEIPVRRIAGVIEVRSADPVRPERPAHRPKPQERSSRKQSAGRPMGRIKTPSPKQNDKPPAKEAPSAEALPERIATKYVQATPASVKAISEGTYRGNTQYAKHAIDGNPDTAWASQWSMPAWLELDLGSIQRVGKVKVLWGRGSHNQNYAIEVSRDGRKWSTVVSARWSKTDATNYSGRDKGNYRGNSKAAWETLTFSVTEARYIRIKIMKTQAPSSHIFQAIVHELVVYVKSKANTTQSSDSRGKIEEFERVATGDESQRRTGMPRYDESRVRHILADIQLGDVAGYYRRHHSPEDKEAIRRWDAGVRVTNIRRFERKVVSGKGWQIVYQGTMRSVSPIEIKLK